MQSKLASTYLLSRYTFLLAAVLIVAIHTFAQYDWSQPLSSNVTPLANKLSTLSHSYGDDESQFYQFGIPSRLQEFGQLKDESVLRKSSAKCDAHIIYQQGLLYRYHAERLKYCTHAAVVGLTIIDNPGDSALFSALLLMMQKLSMRMVYGCPFRECDVEQARIALDRAEPTRKHQCILGVGGGNMQDHTWRAQAARISFVEAFPYLPITFLPQSIQYNNRDYDLAIQDAFEKHGDVVQGVRDALSYQRVVHWKDRNITVDLIPDHAQLHGMRQDFDPRTNYTFLVVPRKDNENGVRHEDPAPFERLVQEPDMQGSSFYMEDWRGQNERRIRKAEPNDRTRSSWLRYRLGMEYLALGELIITDRLHATIVALSIGKPVIIMEEGTYQKVWGYYKTWLSPGCDSQVRFSKNGVPGALELAREWYSNGRQFA